MNSKILAGVVALVVLLLLVGGGAYYWFVLKGDGVLAVPELPQVVRPAGSARLVPETALAYFSAPNAPKSLAGYEQSLAFKLMQEEGVRASWGAASGGQGVDEASWKSFLEVADGLKQMAAGQAFASVLKVEGEKAKQVDWVAGLELTEDQAAFDAWLAKLKALDAELVWEEKVHGMQPYVTSRPKSDQPELVLCAARVGNWLFFGVGESSFLPILDRAATKDVQPGSLLESANYVEALKGLEKDPDLMTFVNLEACVATAERLAPEIFADEKMKEQLERIKVVRFLAMTTTLSGGNWLDGLKMVLLANHPAMTPAVLKPLSKVTARFVARDALAASSQNVDFPVMLAQMKESDAATKEGIEQSLAMFDQLLQPSGLTFEKDILPALGPELTFSLEWAPGKPIPTLIVAVEHQDQAKMKPMFDALQTLSAMAGGMVALTSSQLGNDPLYNLESPLMPGPAISIWVGEKVMTLSFNAGAAEAVPQRTGPGLTESEDFLALQKQLGLPKIEKPCYYMYLDTRRLFINSHGALSTYLPMMPGLGGSGLELPPLEKAEPYLGRSLWMGDYVADSGRLSAIHEKVHPAFLVAASVGWLAELGTKLPQKSGEVVEEEMEVEVDVLMENPAIPESSPPTLEETPAMPEAEQIFDTQPAEPAPQAQPEVPLEAPPPADGMGPTSLRGSRMFLIPEEKEVFFPG
jgi:hypothetical protein